jgi:hypothetical protein
MLWHRELEVNLDLRLDRSTILVEVVKPAAVRVGLGTRFVYDGEVLEVIESHPVAGTPELLTGDLRTDAVRRLALDEMRPSDRCHLLTDEAAVSENPSNDVSILTRWRQAFQRQPSNRWNSNLKI